MKRSVVAAEMVEGLAAFVASLEAGDDPTVRFRTHTVRRPAEPTVYTAEMVRAVRAQLRATEGTFARFLGVSVRTVRGWERGTATPAAMAARFLDEIRQKPDHFRTRLRDVAGSAAGL